MGPMRRITLLALPMLLSPMILPAAGAAVMVALRAGAMIAGRGIAARGAGMAAGRMAGSMGASPQVAKAANLGSRIAVGTYQERRAEQRRAEQRGIAQ